MMGRWVAAAAAIALSAAAQAAAPEAPNRLIVLSDIEADVDDSQSLVRLLLYANQIDIEGLVATTSVWMKHERHPETMRRIIAQYAKVQPNLLKHEPGYPTGEHLLSLVAEGQPDFGMTAVGKGKQSAGSDLIVKALAAPDPRPLWVSIWGGSNTLAQALLTIRDTRSPEETRRMIARLRVYAISDQDDSGPWIRRPFPDLFYIVSPDRYAAATWTAMNAEVEGIDNRTIGNAWIAGNIQQGHGPLGAVYPDVAWGMEGDTPSFLSLIPNGLSVPERPDFGGWGGRYELYTPKLDGRADPKADGGLPVTAETRPIWTNASDSYTPHAASAYGRAVKPGTRAFSDFRVTLWRWRDDFQNDFAARMAWTTLPYDKANHPPVPRLAHPDRLTVHAGDTVRLDGTPSTDPDGDSLSFQWFHYPEAGSWKTPIPIDGADNIYHVTFKAPEVKKPETAHFILRLTDKGTPPLTRYKRIIVTILPR